MKNVVYEIFDEKITTEDSKSMTSYGIRAVCDGDCVASVSDISTDANILNKMVQRCNTLKLAPEQLNEVVEDFLTNISI